MKAVPEAALVPATRAHSRTSPRACRRGSHGRCSLEDERDPGVLDHPVAAREPARRLSSSHPGPERLRRDGLVDRRDRVVEGGSPDRAMAAKTVEKERRHRNAQARLFIDVSLGGRRSRGRLDPSHATEPVAVPSEARVSAGRSSWKRIADRHLSAPMRQHPPRSTRSLRPPAPWGPLRALRVVLRSIAVVAPLYQASAMSWSPQALGLLAPTGRESFAAFLSNQAKASSAEASSPQKYLVDVPARHAYSHSASVGRR